MARTPFAHRPSRRAASLAAGALAALALLVAAAPAAAAPNIGTPGPNWDGGPSAPTSDKPQSKLWYTTDSQGKVTWWATMWNTAGGGTFQIYRFDAGASTWAPTGTVVDPRSLSIQDTLWDGSHLYVASAVSQRPTQDATLQSVDLATRIMRFSFNPSTKAWTKDWENRVDTKQSVQATDPHGVAKPCPGSPGTGLQCVGGTESVTLAKDTSGRVWVTDTRDTGVTATCAKDSNGNPIPDPVLPNTCVQATASNGLPQWASTGRSVYVYHSTAGDGGPFTTPYVLPTGTQASTINPDDISAVVAFDGKVGVFWANQNTQVFYFATHDVANPNDQQWTLQTAYGTPGGSWSDDHFNLKALTADPSGQVFAVAKTSRNDLGSSRNGDPVTVFLRRDAAGNWTSAPVNGVNRQGSTDFSPTRATLELDPTNRTAYVFSSSPCCSGGTIFEKLSNIDNPSFDSAATHLGAEFMRDGSVSSGGLNNPSTSKQPAPAGDFLYVLAGQVQTHFYWWNRIAINKPTPPLKPGDCPGDPRCPKPPPTLVCPGNPNCPTSPTKPVEPPKPIVLTSRLGAVSASLRYFRNADSAVLDGQLQISRAGRVLLAGPLALRCRACRGKIEAGNGHAPALRVLRLQRGSDPQVLLTFQTRGTTISLIYRMRRGRLAVTGVNWGAPGFTLRDLNRDRIPELLSRDTRYQRVTAGGADAFLPLRILSFRAGRLVLVTKRFPRSLSSDSTKLLRTYRSLRGKRGHDLRGVLAAYPADVTAFGRAARAKPLLADALRRGKLEGRGHAPEGRRFISWLPRFVRATGYGR